MSKKNTATTGYSGSVKVKVLDGKKIVKTTQKHNNATQWFLQVLASCVIGNNEQNNMPRFLSIFNESGEALITKRVLLTGKSFRLHTDEVTGAVGVIASFSAIIPYRSLRTTSEAQSIAQISIYGNMSDDLTKLADVYLDEGEQITIPANTTNNIGVEWDMFFRDVADNTDPLFVVAPTSGGVKITGLRSGIAIPVNLIIPSVIGSSLVVGIGKEAFKGQTTIQTVSIPNSVTSIGYSAFSGCSGLTSITVASGNAKYHSAGNCIIETASKTLIAGCKSSVIPTDGSVTSIGDLAFRGCSGLTSITIPSSVTGIGRGAFSDCDGLTGVTFENTSNWYVTQDTVESGIAVDVSTPATNVTYLTDTYLTYQWYVQSNS